jgi:hypothetical protein
MPPKCKSIPTTGPRGLRFRSRLEARWAFVFDKLKLLWHFEPIDMHEYIPDFLIDNGDGTTLLVEVKGTILYDDLKQHVNKIFESGWKEDFVIIGACAWEREFNGLSKACIGLFGSCSTDDQSTVMAFIDQQNGHRITKNVSEPHQLMDYQDFQQVYSDSQNKTQWKKKRVFKKRKVVPKTPFNNMFNLS